MNVNNNNMCPFCTCFSLYSRVWVIMSKVFKSPSQVESPAHSW
jgi:hypothetical protein